MNLDADRLVGLARTKLQSLVRGEYPTLEAEAASFNAGAGLVHQGRAFVYLVEETPSPMGAALAWGKKNGAREINVVVDHLDPTLVLQAAGLDPAPRLWLVEGSSLVEAPLMTPPLTGRPPHEQVLAQVPALRDAELDVVTEHGVVVGEVLGLEVARIVVDEVGRASIRVGVGLYDQEAHELLHADAPVADRLAVVIDEVLRHRRRDAGPHPLNRVARERWLRSLVLSDPAVLGLVDASPLEPLAPRGGIHQQVPAAAAGVKPEGSKVIVVCSTGIDLDLVPTAAGHIGRDGESVDPDEIILVLPERDHHSIVEQMAEQLKLPTSLTSVDDPWP